MCVEISIKKTKWAVLTFYRPPNYNNVQEFFKAMRKSVESLLDKYSYIIIIGDINIDTLDIKDPCKKHYDEFIDTFSLKNLIKSNTCFTKSHESSIDVILTNAASKLFNNNVI